MTYDTGNPVPSIDPRDVDDNAAAFDRFLQSSAASEPDRLGQLRKTWHQMELDAAALVSPNVSALAAVTAAVNKGVYFSGSSPVAMSAYDLSAYVRSISGAANQGAFRSAISAAMSGVNSDITQLTGLTTALSVSQGGTGAVTSAAARTALGVRNTSTRHIDGLNLTWGASTVTVPPGSAYIPSSGTTLEVAAALTINLTGMAANTFYHVYVYSNAGTPAAEMSLTVPLAVATGGAIKTGDNTRRYIGSFYASGATAAYRFVQVENRMYYDVGGIASAPFSFSGSAITSTNVTAPAVPVTALTAAAMLNNASTTAGTSVRVGTPNTGTLSNTNFRQSLSIGGEWQGDLLLDASQQFSYKFDATPSAPFVVRVNGYTFAR